MDYDNLSLKELEGLRETISRQKKVTISTLSELLDRENHVMDAIMKKSNTVQYNVK